MPQVPLRQAIKTERLTPFGNALAGAMGAVVSSALVYPLDTVKTRIQGASTSTSTSSSSSSSQPTGEEGKSGVGGKNAIVAILMRTWEKEGLEGFFRGFGANMISTFSMQFAYFFFHSTLRSLILKRLGKKSLTTAMELVLGAMAGALAQVFTIPVAVIATRQQLHESGSDADPDANPNSSQPHVRADPTMIETAREIIEESGVTGLWTGLKPGLVLTVNPAITYGVFERLKAGVMEGSVQGNLGPGWSFLLGMTSKSLATVVTYPYIFAKVRLQAKPTVETRSATLPSTEGKASSPVSFADAVKHEPTHHHKGGLVTAEDLDANKEESHSTLAITSSPAPISTLTSAPASGSQKRHTSAIALLKATYASHGFKGWYQGMAAQLLKAVLSQGILFMLKDQFERYALILMILARRSFGKI